MVSPAFTEWMMGWPRGWVTAVPGLTFEDQLRICGNGVVPQQATLALRILLGISEEPDATGDLNLLPTPCACDWKDGDYPASHARKTPSIATITHYFPCEVDE